MAQLQNVVVSPWLLSVQIEAVIFDILSFMPQPVPNRDERSLIHRLTLFEAPEGVVVNPNAFRSLSKA
jgi:hypothetical protein